MTKKLWAVTAETYVRYPDAKEGENNWHRKETLLEFEMAETEEEAERTVKNRVQDSLDEEQALHNEMSACRVVLRVNSVVNAYLVPLNPPPPIPKWLTDLKKGDLVYSDIYNEIGQQSPMPYEFLGVEQCVRMGSGIGVWIVFDGKPKLLDSGWIERPLELPN